LLIQLNIEVNSDTAEHLLLTSRIIEGNRKKKNTLMSDKRH